MITKVVNLRKEKYDIYIGRGSPYGNPFKIGIDGSREEVINKFKEYIKSKPELIEDMKKNLKGKILGCYCKPFACHGDIIVELIEGK